MTTLDESRLRRRRYRNHVTCVVLLAGLAILLGTIGWILWGPGGIGIVAGFGTGLALLGRGASGRMLLNALGAKPIDWGRWPLLDALLTELSRRAGLGVLPRLHLMPAPIMTAFTLGLRANDMRIVVTDQLLKGLSVREMASVLAHEIGHIRSHDTMVMGIADSITYMTRLLSLIGLVLILFKTPLFIMGDEAVPVSWTVIALLFFAPHLSMYLQMALSRTREYEADRTAVELTGDPEGLAVALNKLEHHQVSLMERLTGFRFRVKEPSLLRSHPETEMRVKSLKEDAKAVIPLPAELISDDPIATALPPRAIYRRLVPFFGVWR